MNVRRKLDLLQKRFLGGKLIVCRPFVIKSFPTYMP